MYKIVFVIAGLLMMGQSAIAQGKYTAEERIRNAMIWGRSPTAEEWRSHREWMKNNCFKKYPEREIARIKRRNADTLEDIQRQTRIAQGEDIDIVGDEQKVADIKRKERDTNLRAENCD